MQLSDNNEDNNDNTNLFFAQVCPTYSTTGTSEITSYTYMQLREATLLHNSKHVAVSK